MHVVSSKLNPSPTAVRTAIHCCIIVRRVAIRTRLSARHGASACGKFTVFSTAVWTSTARLIFSESLSFLRDYNSRSLIQCGPRGAAPFVVRIRHIWCCQTSPMVRKLGENLPIGGEGPLPAGDNININNGNDEFTTHVRRMFLPHCSQIGTQIQIQAASFKLPIRGSSIHAHVS